MRNKDETKVKLILDTALQMIARIGLSGLKMSDLAKEAGIATGTVYIYFEDKNQLIKEIYLQLIQTTHHDLAEGILATDPLKIRINKITRNYLNNNIKNPSHGAFLEQYFRSPYVENQQENRWQESTSLQPMFALVQEGQRQSLIKEADTQWLVLLICGMLNEIAKKVIYTKIPLSDAQWELTFSVLWDGIKG